MTYDPPDDIDRRLCETFEPDSRAVARVVAGAASARLRPRPATRLAWAAAMLVALATAAVVYERPWTSPPDKAEDLLLSGSFDNDVLIVLAADGSVSVSGPGTRDDRPQDGSGIVLVEGEPR